MLKLIICGLAAGAVNGILGSGGGILLVPLFLSWIKMPPRKAFATSVSVTLPLSAVTAVICLSGQSFDFKAALPYLLGGAAGGVLCGIFFKKVPVLWLRRLFGALLIFGGIRSVFFG